MKVSSDDGLVHVHKGQQGSDRPQRAGGNESHKPAESPVVHISQAAFELAAIEDSDFNQLSNDYHRRTGGGADMQRGIGAYSK